MALAVAMVACQGAVGKTGDPGPKGEPGDPAPPAPPANLAPQARALVLPAVMLVEEGEATTINVATNFFDTDAAEGETLTLSHSGADASVVGVTLTGGMLTVTPVAAGTTVITVKATDAGGLSASATIAVTVHPEGMAPPMYIEGSLPDVIELEPGDKKTITDQEIMDAFEEGEGETLEFSFSVDGNSVNVTWANDDDYTIDIVALSTVGDSMVTITATDEDNLTDEHTIEVAVRAELGPVRNSMDPESVDLSVGGESKTIDASDYFDVDADVGDLMYTASADPVDGVVSVEVDGTMVELTPEGMGEATVTITADNGHGMASVEIMVNVESTPPTVSMPIEDFSLGAGLTHPVYLSQHFAGDGLSYSFRVDGTAATAVISGGDTLIVTAGSAAGEATVTVTATDDDGETVMDAFVVTVTVAPTAGVAPTNPTPIPPQTSDIGASTKTTIDVSGYFTGADSYTAVSRNPDKVMATATTAGIVTLTPVAHGTARVRVTASNSAGSISDEFDVTVRAPAKFMMDKSLPDLRIQVRTPADGSTADGKKILDDLSTLFTDPDDPSATLKFTTTTSDATKVQVVKLAGTREEETSTPTVPPSGDPATDKAVTVMGRDVVLFARAAGTAKITVKVTDSDELSIMESFMVTVTEELNAAPGSVDLTADSDDSLKNDLPDLIGTNRLKLSESKVVIDDKAIKNYFTDGDLERPSGDLLKFSVEYYKGATGPTVAAGVVTYAAGSKIDDDDDDLVATATVMPMTWDGDDFGSSDKFTVTVTPKKAGGSTTADNAESQGIVIIATDLSGMKALQTFEVQVNNPPVAHGPTEASRGDAQKTLAKLSKTYMDLGKASGFSQISTTAHTITMVAANATDDDYFSDKDGDDESAALNCRFDLSGADIFPDVTGTTPVDYPKWADASVRRVLQLAANGTTAFKNQGTAHIDVWCTDAAGEASPKARLTIMVTSDGVNPSVAADRL